MPQFSQKLNWRADLNIDFILGFFSTGDAEAPGNYGLLDQSLALRLLLNLHVKLMNYVQKLCFQFG